MTIDPLNLAGTASLTFKAAFVSLSLWNGTTGVWGTDFWYDPIHGNGNSLQNNGEQEWYINANDRATGSVTPWTVADNVLSITMAKTPGAIRPLIDGYKYTSGEINTFHSFSQKYGYFEMRARLPAGKGLWPAFWLLPENGTWPPELDIMEVLGRDPKTLYTTVHSSAVGGAGQGGDNNIATGIAVKVPNTSLAFHTYGADWEADTITWYFDRKPVFQVATPADMHQPMFIEANLAGGGPWAGRVDPQKLPAAMQIDYIEAWSKLPASAHAVSQSRTNSGQGGEIGKTLVADDTAGQILKGTPRNDTFYAGHNSVVMEGRGGSDMYVFNDVPWNAGQITDFNPLADRIDVSAILASVGYRRTAPFSDGILSIRPTQEGGAELHFLPASTGSSMPPDILIVTLDRVSPSSLGLARNFVVH